MSHTNETPNYKLPLFVDNDVPSWLGDFNEAMNELDAGMGDIKNSNVAQNVAITNLQSIVNGQVTDITNLKSTTADQTAAIAELHEGLDTAETDLAGKAPINHASTGTGYGVGDATNYGHVKLSDSGTIYTAANGFAATPQGVVAILTDFFTFEEVTVAIPSGVSDGYSNLGCVVSKNKKLFKFYGILRTSSGNEPGRSLIPGSNSRYGCKITNGANISTNKYIEIVTGGINCNGSLTNENVLTTAIAVGTDGEIYVHITDSATYDMTNHGIFTYPACIYIAANFGDISNA